MTKQALLSVEGLTVDISTKSGMKRLLDNVSFSIFPGETVGLVGESGSGKSLTAQAIMRLLPSPPMQITRGKILWEGHELSDKELRQISGKELSMVFQDPMVAFNPIKTIGKQIGEIPVGNPTRRHLSLEDKISLLESVGIDHPRERLKQYPYELSGGMCQRAFIAMAIAQQPRLLIADEPTTALDATVQAQVLELLSQLQVTHQMSLLLITHDLGIAAAMCQRVLVMHEGVLVESGSPKAIFSNPSHPYTQMLIEAIR